MRGSFCPKKQRVANAQRAQAALDDACIFGVQYLAIRVFKSDGTEHLGYSVANILNRLPIAEGEKTISTPVSASATALPERIALNAKSFRAYHILRPEEFVGN